MTAVLAEQRVGTVTTEIAYWMHNEAGQTIASTGVHPDFIALLSSSGGGNYWMWVVDQVE